MTRTTGIAVCLAVVAVTGLWYGLSRGPKSPSGDNPGSSSSAPRFVGAAACRACHRSIFEAYETSGHAHTFQMSADSAAARSLVETEFTDPQRQRTFRYHLDPDGLSVGLPGHFGGERFPLQYALGSGTQAVTFLTLLPHGRGQTVGLEHRVSYYTSRKGPGLTVGHEFLPAPVEDAESFGKIVDHRKLLECLGCHTTQFTLRGQELTDLIPHVSCEKCHGPGSQHVSAQTSGMGDPGFADAQRWPTALDEVRTCGACHRLPETLKPSELTRSSPVLPRFQPAGLMQSRCFTQSRGELRCTTCHDPHGRVSTDTFAYEQTCRDCHSRQSVHDCPKGETGCVACHLPRIGFEGVAGFHDHWIRIRNHPEDPLPLASD